MHERLFVYKQLNNFTVYRSLGYMDVVAKAAEASMNLAVREIKDLPGYADSGEVNLVCTYTYLIVTCSHCHCCGLIDSG